MREVEAQIGRRDLTCEGKWQPLDFDSVYKVTKPTIICLSGNTAVERKYANGICRIAEDLLSFMFSSKEEVTKQIDLIGLSYGLDYKPSEARLKNGFRPDGDLSKRDRERVVDKILLPLCLDKKQRPLPIEQACKNMSLIRFFTYCHGYKEALFILDDFRKRVMEKGYILEEASKLLNSIFQASFSPLVKGAVFCPEVVINSKNDEVNNFFVDIMDDYETLVGEKIDGIMIDKEKPGKYFMIDTKNVHFDSIKIMTSKLLNEHEDLPEHNLTILDRDEKWNLKDNTDANADCVSQMLAWALGSSIDNSFKNLESKEFIPFDTNALYKELMNIERTGFTQESLKDQTKIQKEREI